MPRTATALVVAVIATQLELVHAECAITPDGNGHVDIPSTWTEIDNQAFYQCTSLKSVNIPDSVTFIYSVSLPLPFFLL